MGLPATIICHLVDDGEGNLWISSHRGVLRASKAELHRCADGAAKSLHCLSYGKAEGLASQVCSGGFQPGACKAADGRIWVPTARGIAIIDPATVTTNTIPPPVVIEELLVDRRPFEIANQAAPLPGEWGQGRAAAQAQTSRQKNLRALQIPPGKQRFEIHYTALSFAAPEKVRFRHKLAGLERDWVEAGTTRLAEYSYLPPGDYSFQVIACNNDEVWNQDGASLSFTVLPYFWQTWWFQAVAIISGAGAVGASVLAATRRRVRRKLELVERQRALERERSRIARDIHDDLGASLTRITMLSQTVRSELESAPQAAADVDQIYTTARELTKAMDEIVWAVNPRHDTLDSLVTYLGRFAQEFLSAAGIRCRLEVPMHLPAWALTAEIRHNVFLAFKEALHNIVKHAAASEVQIFMELFDAGFVLVIADNGRGFELDGQSDLDPLAPISLAPAQGGRGSSTRLAPGNGLPNMRKRLDEVGGRCEWDTAPAKGTRVKLTVLVKRHGRMLP